jgi:transcriptional regulator GlxA family with amidase domain
MQPREIVIVAFPDAQSLDITGPLEVFAGASRVLAERGLEDPGYRVRVAARERVQLRCASGLRLVPDVSLDEAGGPIDTLIVAGGSGSRAAVGDAELLAGIRALARDARRVASVCTGAFLLAEAGLLDGRRVTTHWAACEALARRYPAVEVDADPIWVRDGDVYTSAGVTAGMDLALALVEEDLGRDVALTVARWLVLFLRRPGNQSQFSAQLAGQLAGRAALRELQAWIVEHPDAELTVEALAARVAMSPRHFARSFRREVGLTPGRYVERVRVETARRRLEDSTDPIEHVADACGFGTAETMRRSFIRALGVPPAEYRRRFAAAA